MPNLRGLLGIYYLIKANNLAFFDESDRNSGCHALNKSFSSAITSSHWYSNIHFDK